jgi:hypothetical protein
MGAFGSNFADFRAIWLGTTEPKPQNRYGAADQNIQTFIANLGYLWLRRTSWIDSAPFEPSNSSQSGHTGTNVASFPRTNIYKKEETGELSIFGNFGRGYLSSFTSVRLQDKTRVLRTRVDLCYHCRPFPACLGGVFNHLSVRTSFLRTYLKIYGYTDWGDWGVIKRPLSRIPG